MNPLQSSQLPSAVATAAATDPQRLRVATYNIHKGVRGMGPAKRLEIHNLGLGVEALDADLVFLQEVRQMNRQEARRFPGARPLASSSASPLASAAASGAEEPWITNVPTNVPLARTPVRAASRTAKALRPLSSLATTGAALARFHSIPGFANGAGSQGWPELPQAEFLAPEGYSVAYHTNAVTRHGEHGNALLSRWSLGQIGHHDVSAHRFEQRGLLHVRVLWHETEIHAIVAHFGLGHAGRVLQAARLAEFVQANVPEGAPLVIAGDFNDWGEKLDEFLEQAGVERALQPGAQRPLTFPSRVPVFAMDRIYTRGFRCISTFVPRGGTWARMSDHLPLVAELELA